VLKYGHTQRTMNFGSLHSVHVNKNVILSCLGKYRQIADL